MSIERSGSGERFEAARVKRARADIEETIQGLRQRREPSAFAVKYAPQEAETARQYLRREDQRMADEQAGRPTKPFVEMDGFEIFCAMASYPGPGHYPHELEAIAQEMAERPVPDVSDSDQEALSEVIGIRQRFEAGEREVRMVERLSELSEHPSDSVRVAAKALWFQLVEQALSGNEDVPTPEKPEN